MLLLKRLPSTRIGLIAIALALATACAATPVTTPRSRVAQDLGCTTEGTKVDKIADIPGEKSARWQVTGCGRAAVYVCTTPVRDCWREGEIGPATAAPPPPPAPPAP
ncbi:MAG: hypothetical protein QOI41_288 [Myxococcales bacterium]|nr:hypothetical protein [Myxococcales bacterium]